MRASGPYRPGTGNPDAYMNGAWLGLQKQVPALSWREREYILKPSPFSVKIIVFAQVGAHICSPVHTAPPPRP